MTLVMRCEDKERLVGYMYGEISAEDRAGVEAHLATCALCSSELAELRIVRGDLARWSAPEPDLGFRVTREVVSPARRSRTIPAWAQAAAAVLVLGAAAGLANLDITYGREGLTVRTGWRHETGTPPSRLPAQSAQAAGSEGRVLTASDLAAVEQRLRAELLQNTRGKPVAPSPVSSSASSRDVVQQVRSLIDESERRQQKELALRLAQVLRDVDSQRRADLVRIEQNMGQIEGVTGQEVVRQREMLNYLMRVSQRP